MILNLNRGSCFTKQMTQKSDGQVIGKWQKRPHSVSAKLVLLFHSLYLAITFSQTILT